MFAHLTSTITRMIPYRYTGKISDCHLCGADDKETVGRRDRYGNKLHTVGCKNCGLVFTDPMPTDKEVETYYTRFYRKHYHNAEQPSKRAIYKNFKGAQSIAKMLAPVIDPETIVLDVGAGGGQFVATLVEQGIKAKGIEPNEGFAEFARKSYGIDVQCCMWESAEIEPGSIGLITANHVVEHFRNPFGALEKFYSWLKPGGYLYISVPNIVRSQKTPYARFHFGHIYNFSPKTLRMMARKAGFEEYPILPEGDTTLVLRKVDGPDPNWFYAPNHGQEILEYFKTQTNLRHFLSFNPYRRWLERMSRLSKIMLASQFSDGRNK